MFFLLLHYHLRDSRLVFNPRVFNALATSVKLTLQHKVLRLPSRGANTSFNCSLFVRMSKGKKNTEETENKARVEGGQNEPIFFNVVRNLSASLQRGGMIEDYTKQM